MPTLPLEPPRKSDLSLLVDYFADRVRRVIAALEARGFDPVPWETLRSQERQDWLYGIGRTHSLSRKPVTWTLKSRHLVGKACDLVSRSRLWAWPAFYVALREEALKEGLRDAAGGKKFNIEGCHIQWG